MRYTIIESAAAMPSSCKYGPYRKLGIVATVDGGTIPQIIRDTRTSHVLCTWDRLYAGLTERCALEVARGDAERAIERFRFARASVDRIHDRIHTTDVADLPASWRRLRVTASAAKSGGLMDAAGQRIDDLLTGRERKPWLWEIERAAALTVDQMLAKRRLRRQTRETFGGVL